MTETFAVKRERQAFEQVRVNAIYRALGAAETMKEIRHLAALAHAPYPQYDGYWDGEEWTLARCTTPLKSKGGLQADTGDVVLYRMRDRYLGSILPGRDDLFYSVRLGWNCSAGFGLQVIRSRYTGEPVG